MFSLVSFALAIVLTVTAAYLFRSKQNLPPSPIGFPVIGHLHLLKDPVHRCLHDLSRNLGPVFSLRLGSCQAVIVTSASAAEEFLSHENDVVFASRPISTLGKYVGYNNSIVSLSPYGDHWRNLRRICTVEIFSAARLKESFEIRRDEVRSLLGTIHAATSGGGNDSVRVELRPLLSGFTLNVLTRMVAGKRYYGEDNGKAKEVRELIRETLELCGFTYAGDFLPILKLFDFDGYLTRVKKLGSNMDKFLQELVDEHKRNRGKVEFKNTMITHLLTLQESQPEYYTDEIIKGLVLVMIVAGSDTTAVTLEWAMANLLNHPDVLAKSKMELNNVVSNKGRLMEESDTNTCTYLDNVISETLRLYPPGPILVPHASSDDCKVAGYDIPRGTWLFINAWAIQRDPKVWDEPEVFKPERFDSEESKIHHAKFLPFGIGRRACPGMGLAQIVLSSALGSLIQCFDLERDEDMAVDMLEGTGLTVPKAVPLVAKCKSSPILDNVMIVSGAYTTAMAIEWTIANLLNHPDVLAKVKTELNNVVSSKGRLMEESDTSTCTYLNNVISESLRQYPTAPMLVPHASSVDCKVAGYDIPRGTWLFINAWAIQRDPKRWDEPEAFIPERFNNERSKVQSGKFMPFEIGRRACLGMRMSQLVLGLVLGSLIQCFDWEREEDVTVDMSEGKGFTMPKIVPLAAKCKSSPILDNIIIYWWSLTLLIRII